MKLLPLISFLFFTAGAANAAPIQTQWEIERLISPEPIDASGYDLWAAALPLGSLTGSGRSQYFTIGEANVGLTDFLQHSISGGAGLMEFNFQLAPTSDYTTDGIWWNVGFALLRTPTGYQAVARKNPFFLDFLDFPSGQIRASILPAPPMPGQLPQLGWEAFWNAGDINQDGYDDLFFQSFTPNLIDGYTGLIDGATHQVVWRKYALWASLVKPITPDPTTGYPDLNGDSVPDFVSGWLNAIPPYTSFSKRLIAYSGVDGSIIWDVLVGSSAGYGTSGRDMNADGVADIVTIGSQFNALAVDGATGNVLWTSPMAPIELMTPGSGTDYRFGSLVFFENVSGPETTATVSIAFNRVASGPINGNDHFIAKLDATDGTPISVAPMAGDLNPWLDDFVRPNNNLSFLLGDIDRDGYTEIAQHVDTPSLDPGSVWPPGASTSLAILGPSTISVPGGHSIGQTNTISFDIPSAGNMLLQLIVSTEFDPKGGVEIDHWPTNLVQGPMMTWSQQQGLLVLLDQYGGGSINLTLPNKSALIGTELFMRGIVWDPAAPYDKVWTLSSLGRTLILP